MSKKTLPFALLCIVLVAGYSSIVSVYAQYKPVDVRDPYHFKDEGISDPDYWVRFGDKQRQKKSS